MQSKQTFLALLFICSFLIKVNGQVQKTYSSSELLLQLKKLNTVGSVLYIAAHPDDENTRLIAYLANEKCLRTGYLSLTRGDGGQNLIGSEQGIELGMIRTQELLAARRVDGGEQFFTRAYDFGYSKTPVETFNKWNHDSILGDVVYAIRLFRPDIIITRFATDGSGGHGHHTASAMLAEEAFDAAADPTKFPEQLEYVSPWKTRRLFWNVSTRFQNPNADMSPYIKMDVGGYNPLLGKSYGEIAAESRSMHKSQGFGSAKQRGESLEFFKSIKGDTIGLKTIFDGMDFTWKRFPLNEPVGMAIDRMINTFNPQQPDLIASDLIKVKAQIKYEREISYKQKQITDLVKNCLGLYTEFNAEKPYYAKGDTIKFSSNGINRSSALVTQRLHVSSYNPQDFTYPLDAGDMIFDSVNKKLTTEKNLVFNKWSDVKLKIIPTFPFEQNFFYGRGLKNNFYIPVSKYERELPEPILSSTFKSDLNVAGETMTVVHPLTYKWTDPEKGELNRPVIVVPKVIMSLSTNVLIFDNNEPREVILTIKAMSDNIKGMLKIALPQGWFVEAKGSNLKGKLKEPEYYGLAFNIDKKSETQLVNLVVYPSKTESNTSITINAEINGESYSYGMKEIKYDHIPVQTLFTKTEVKLIKLDVKHKLKKIGYIPGAGDEVQPCLNQIGYEVISITDEYLAKGDLSKFEAIITGVRAYNTNDKLSDYKQQLMEYVSNGGNLIVQYNTNSFAGPLKADLGPYKFKITRDRITDEEAKVVFDIPDHAVFNKPNKITEKDFEGWIQERSIYHAGDWDANFVAPISMNDPGEKPNKGALIIAKHGKGNFIYTGLVFFRELPAGIPGAYRLMVNLIELGK